MSEQINASGLIGDSASKPMEVQVTVHGENAVLHFSAPREYVAFTGPEALLVGARLMVAAIEAQPHAGNSAIQAAMAIIDAVYEMRGDLKPAGGAVKHELIERHRRTLTNRMNTVLTSTREKKTTTNEKLAKQLVDIMLHEVFA